MILQTGWVKCEGKSGNDFLQLGVFTNRRVYQLDNLVCLHGVRDPIHRNGLALLTVDVLLDKQVRYPRETVPVSVGSMNDSLL